MLARLRPPLLAVAAGVAAVFALASLWPPGYVATARLLRSSAHGESRIMTLETSAAEPGAAAARVRALLARHRDAQVLDPPTVLPARRSLPAWILAGALAGLLLGVASVVARERRRRPVRHERELIAALGPPLLATHPSGSQAARALCGQLIEHWFVGGRRLLPIVELDEGEGGVALACELAAAFAAMGERTLLVDADLRAPRLHVRFRVARGKGLADALDGLDSRDLRLVRCRDNLALLTAGRVRRDPLELLGRPRLRRLLAGAARPFGVVLVCTPPLERAPDFEIFAALAGGALVFAGREPDAAALAALRKRLERCAARVVGTVLERG